MSEPFKCEVWETGNNDLPCPNCPKGDTAVFNVCTADGMKQMTGAETKAHDRAQADKNVFLVYTTTEEGHGGVYLWWKPKRSGYTRYVEEAGRYSLVEALEIIRMRGEEGAVPLDVVLENASKVLKIGKLHEKLEPGLHGLPVGWRRKQSDEEIIRDQTIRESFRNQTLREHGLGHHASDAGP